MPKRIDMWTCSVCGKIFWEQAEAENCEKHHVFLDKLEILGVVWSNVQHSGNINSAGHTVYENLEKYPVYLLMSDGSGDAAEYMRTKISSVESFDRGNGGKFFGDNEF